MCLAFEYDNLMEAGREAGWDIQDINGEVYKYYVT